MWDGSKRDEMGHAISPNSVRKPLTELGYFRKADRRQTNAPTILIETRSSTISMPRLWQREAAGQPVISVYTKKELVGNYRNAGRDYRPKGDPKRAKVHDFRGQKPRQGRALWSV